MTKVWGHRGASGTVPENTLDAFARAAEMGADGVELDVQLTKDGQIVVIHDETVDRVSGMRGFVRDRTLSELRELNVSLPRPEYGKVTRIPTLEEVFDLLKDTGICINVELKTGIFKYEGIEKKVADLILRTGYLDRIWCSSFNHESVLRAKELCPELRCGLLFEDIMVSPAEYAVRLGVEALHPATYHFEQDPLYVAKAKEKGLETHIWTVNEREQMAALAACGTEAIITNYPDIALEVLGR